MSCPASLKTSVMSFHYKLRAPNNETIRVLAVEKGANLVAAPFLEAATKRLIMSLWKTFIIDAQVKHYF